MIKKIKEKIKSAWNQIKEKAKKFWKIIVSITVPTIAITTLLLTGPIFFGYPQSVSSVSESPYDDNAWSNPTRAEADDGSYASITSSTFDTNDYSYVMKATNFGFEIPADCRIDGIMVEIEGYGANGTSKDVLVQLTKDGTRIGDNKATLTNWEGSPTVREYGGPTDLWGEEWTASEIDASTFGVHFAVQATGDNADIYIDFVRVTIYDDPGSRYWVGGTGDWSDDDHHWATSSNGTPADGNLPTISDNVFIDANSGFGGGGTITLDVSDEPYNSCNDFISTSGHTYTIDETSWALRIYGSVTFESGLTISGDFETNFFSDSLDETITINGATITGLFGFSGTGKWTLQDDLTITGQFYQENGTFDANDHNVTASEFYFYAAMGYTPTVVMGSGTWEATGGDWFIDEEEVEVVTITPETSTIKMSGVSPSFTGGGKTYYNLWFAGSLEGYIRGVNTFNDLKINAGLDIYFDTKTQTVSSFTATGTEGNLITLDSIGALYQFTLSKSSGTVECDYLDISNSNATGGATWYAGSHSADTSNNDGWIFTDPPSARRIIIIQ